MVVSVAGFGYIFRVASGLANYSILSWAGLASFNASLLVTSIN